LWPASQVPLYYYGVTILKSEIKNLETHTGDDLAIPEFANIQAAMKDTEGRLATLAQIKLRPVVVSEDAFQSDGSTSPSAVTFAAGFLLAGVVFGYLWALIRARKRTARA
jgi:hypothetical protein